MLLDFAVGTMKVSMARHSWPKPSRSAEKHTLLSGALSQADVLAGSIDRLARMTPELELKQLEAELRAVLDAVHSGVLLLAVDGRIRFANGHFGTLFGLDPGVLASLARIEDLARLFDPLLRVPG